MLYSTMQRATCRKKPVGFLSIKITYFSHTKEHECLKLFHSPQGKKKERKRGMQEKTKLLNISETVITETLSQFLFYIKLCGYVFVTTTKLKQKNILSKNHIFSPILFQQKNLKKLFQFNLFSGGLLPGIKKKKNLIQKLCLKDRWFSSVKKTLIRMFAFHMMSL